MISATVSIRQSIRWLPDEPDEPTNTIVLTGGKTGVFLDTRFYTDGGLLDWAVAGYRRSVAGGGVKFEHHIDSRTLNARDVVSECTNIPRPDGTTLEIGEMVNPDTGIMTRYEEIWSDEELEGVQATFIKNGAGTRWQASVGNWQMGMGRTDGKFWAWQATKNSSSGQWSILFITPKMVDEIPLKFLPEIFDSEWVEGSEIVWEGERWNILEHSESLK